MNRESLIPLVSLREVNKTYRIGKESLVALKSINLSIFKGETLGIAGESGSGKSTLGKILLGLEKATSGKIFFQGKDIYGLSKADSFNLRKEMQVVFQDPFSSLNPRMNVESIIGEGIDIHQLAKGIHRLDKISKLLHDVALTDDCLKRYPHEFSGGQRQRIAIARALAVDPKILVCDEPLSALDACTSHQVMELFLKLKKEFHLSMLFISHDLHSMKKISDHMAIMYLGSIVEKVDTKSLFENPKHPYTRALLASIPNKDPSIERNKLKVILSGDPPSPLHPPSGCPFHPRCKEVMPICKIEVPPLKDTGTGHFVACHLYNKTND